MTPWNSFFDTVCVFISLFHQVQSRAVPLLWWGLRQRWRNLCLSSSKSPSGSSASSALLHPVWLLPIQSDPPVPTSGSVPAPGATKGSWDPPGCRQASGLSGLSVRHHHHCQARAVCTQLQAGQEDRQRSKGSGWKWSEQEKRCYGYDLKWEVSGFTSVFLTFVWK